VEAYEFGVKSEKIRTLIGHELTRIFTNGNEKDKMNDRGRIVNGAE
jgi:hypothetical protein